jgi:hypothetical protein
MRTFANDFKTPGNQLCYPASSQSMQNTIETLNVGTPRESTLLPGILSKHVKHIETLNVGTPRETTLLPGIISKRVKHNRNVECGHSQGLNFLTRHPLRACKTQ